MSAVEKCRAAADRAAEVAEKAVQTAARAADMLEALQAKYARAIDLLSQLEWYGTQGRTGWCPRCLANATDGHNPYCALAAVLKEATP